MIAVGRISSSLVLIAVLALIFLGTIRPDLAHIGTMHVLDWFGGMLYVAAPVSWISGIFHWGTRFPRVGRRTMWGLVVVLGFVPGAIVYWFWGARHAVAPDDPL